MVSLREMKEKGYIPSRLYLKLMLAGTLSLTKVILTTSPRDLRKLRALPPPNERYVRPPRPYKLPKYKPGMKYCDSD